MDGLEKPAPPKEDEADGRLYREYLALKPRFSSKEDALAHYTKELSALEKRVGLTANEMLDRHESSSEINEDYRLAVRFLRKITFFKKK
ncbi:MAG: hypothetical protein HYZ71_14230 [Deltaproteobacteria bacterium]|nr:hypothetical protein [Deltaproteobacteria bacterium]